MQTIKNQGRPNFSVMLRQLKDSKNCRTILVEKADQLARNCEDIVLLNQLDLEIHFAKCGTVYSKEAEAQTKFMQNIELATAVYYSENLRQEVIKGLREKAEQGFYPGRAPFGYRNSRETGNIEPHPKNAQIVRRAYELYATGLYSLTTLARKLREEFGKARTSVRLLVLLKKTTYMGIFRWNGASHQGSYKPLVSPELFNTVQVALSRRPERGSNRGTQK